MDTNTELDLENGVTGDAASAEADAAKPEAAGCGELETQLAAERARADENHQKHLYALAELENYRKRVERQVHDRIAAGKKATLAKFLPVLDNIERALGIEQTAPGLRGGLQATVRGFEALLSSEGVKPFDVLGKPFDPHTSEAVGTRTANDAQDDMVVDVAERGYMLGDEVLRPAKVIVAKRASAE
jgi:molecular chaperone GrpE